MSDTDSPTNGIPAVGDGPRDGRGKFIRSPDTSERDAEAWRLRVEGLTLRQIAAKMGYADHSGARLAIDRAIAEGQSAATEEIREIEIARAEEIYLMARAIARKDRPVVSHGKIMYQASAEGDLTPLVDDSQKLAAMNQMLAAMTRKAKYIRIEVDSKSTEITLAMIQADLARMEARARETGDLP